MENYADASFLVSLFLDDTNSVSAKRFMASTLEPLPFNPLHRLEVRNGIRLALYRKEIREEKVEAVFRQIDSDLEEGILIHCALDWTPIFRHAEELGFAHTPVLGNRAADILHVACALELGSRQFLSFDRRQRALAKAAGLKVKP